MYSRIFYLFLLSMLFIKPFTANSDNSYVITSTGSQLTVITHKDVNVHFGRAAILRLENLQILYDKSEACEVSTVKNDPSHSLSGALLPSTFPCNFKEGDVSYQHYGSMIRTSDVIKLQVRLDTEKKVVIKPFIIRVQVTFEKLFEVIKKVENLIVNELGALSEAITEDILNIKFDKEKYMCNVRFSYKNGGPPYYGSIINASNLLPKFEYFKQKYVLCEEFLSGTLRYAHRREMRSSNRDYIPLVVEIRNKISNVVEKREFVQIPVRIQGAPENEPPIINYNDAKYSLNVDQFLLTAITSNILKADDKETDTDAIIFNITRKHEANEGYLVHIEDPERPLSTFYQREVKQLKIAYKPPPTLSKLQRIQQIWFEARDEQDAASSPFYVIFVIKPTNTRAPRVIKNTGLTLLEGKSRLITRDVLEIRDPDNEELVIASVIGGLFHGKLWKNAAIISSFTVSDIDQQSITYEHDNSETYFDNIILRLSDGIHFTDVMLLVTILPRDDEAPVLVFNTGSTLEEGGLKRIDQFELSATDLDSDDTKITFHIINKPSAGYLCMRLSGDDEVRETTAFNTTDQSNNKSAQWKIVDNSYEQRVSEFSQTDLASGKIYYRHYGDEVFNDIFTFRVSDNAKIPNKSSIKSFFLDITPVDDESPVPHPDSSFQMNVVQDNNAIITQNVMRYTDIDSVDFDLIYSITEEVCRHQNDTLECSVGYFFNEENPHIRIKNFSQKQINFLKVMYKPGILSTANASVLVYFNVTDNAGNSIYKQKLIINILKGNTEAPTPIINTLTITKGASFIISSYNIDANDIDSSEEELCFLIVELPSHGVVLFKIVKLTKGSYVCVKDIHSNKIKYVHDGSQTKNDSIKFILTDGVHKIHTELPIVISSQGDEVKEDVLIKEFLSTSEGGTVAIKAFTEVLDDDVDENMFVYVITVKPKYGIIQKNGNSVDHSFQLKDVNDGKIFYCHTSGEIGYKKQYDQLTIGLSNNSTGLLIGGKLYKEVQLNIEINPVDNQMPVMLGHFVVEVAEGGTSVLRETVLKVVDKDTLLKNINCSVINPPVFGFLQVSSPEEGSEVFRKGFPILTFNGLDLFNGDLSYVQGLHKGIEPNNDKFQLQCTDGINISPQSTIHVTISPTNDEIPIIFVQQKIICIEDDSILLNLAKINPFDRDQPEDPLLIFVTKQPIHGELLIQTQAESKIAIWFPKTVLMSGFEETLVYKHKGTETYNDSFEILVYDGLHNMTKEIEISIVSVDDETPQLTANTGLYLERGETKVITQDDLNAVDLDSEDDSLVYIIMAEPLFGKIQMAISSSKILDLREGENFTQKHINERRIRYMHDIYKSGEHDAIVLDVTDGLNRLINQRFDILVTPEDFIYPSVVSKDLTMKENKQAILTTELLSASDSNSPDEDLLFTVTKIPIRGHLENLEYPYIPITTFTQLDLAENKILYKHTSTDEVKIDSFEFEVTDGRNKLFRTFRIQLLEVNNKIPILRIKTIQATQNHRSIITSFELYASDNDTSSTQIYYKVIEAPKYGQLFLDGVTIITEFTQNHINNNRISYLHDGSEMARDSFTIKLMNEINSEFYLYPDTNLILSIPVCVPISIKSLDIQAPKLKINQGATSLKLHDSRAVFIFSSEVLEATDKVSDPSKLQFLIKKHPKDGIITEVHNKEHKLDKFTQQDINDRAIAYVLKQGSEAISDFFMFDVLDNGGNRLKAQSFTLNWSWVKFVQKKYIVNETDKYIKLFLERTGYLEEVSFVSIFAIDGTALFQKHFDVTRNFQIQFNLGQKDSEFKVKIIDNNKYEKLKSFTISLKKIGIQTLINHDYMNTSVEILDPEDGVPKLLPLSEPRVEVAEKFISVKESIGMLHIPLKRFGDLNGLTKVICKTISISALGTDGITVLSGKDFISRVSSDLRNIVNFKKNQDHQNCIVKIIDDSLYEDEETFLVKLEYYYGGKIGYPSETRVSILKDPMDEPHFSLSSLFYLVHEEDDNVTVVIQRSGTDLSMKSFVSLVTVEDVPLSAKSYSDYLPITETFAFEAHQQEIYVKIKINDDVEYPILEGKETFTVILKAGKNGRISEPSKATITIDDSQSDKPTVYFKNSQSSVDENCHNISVTIMRSGDLQHESSVRCYTRQGTATADQDFKERRNADSSLVLFKKGDFIKTCLVEILDDKIYEASENFDVFLGNPDSKSANGSFIGKNYRSLVVIQDDDKSIIEFKQSRYYTQEPSIIDGETSVLVTVYRTGDVSKTEFVTVFTKDGSAKSGQNYEPLAKLLEFSPNITQIEVTILIRYDAQFSLRTAFSLHIHIENQKITSLGLARTVIYIEEPGYQKVVTFPLKPVVISLHDYDEVTNAKIHPINGYPLICVTACNPKFPEYKATREICLSASINNSLTKYKWQISSPDSNGHMLFKDITMRLFFANPFEVTLDSVYFSGGSHVRCIAQAFTNQENPGVASISSSVTIDSKNGLCMSRTGSLINSEAFSAQAFYTGSKDINHPNLIKLSVQIPHFDGLLPAISTKQLNNFKLTLSPDGTRAALHKCSNLLNVEELQTSFGFNKRNGYPPVQSHPYEFDSELRGEDTVQFYQSLDLDSCLWKFESYYDMSELIKECGGSISTSAQVKNSAQSSLEIILPFYVSYLYHSITGEDGWVEFNHHTFFQVTALYNTGLMSENGVGFSQNQDYKGKLYLTRLLIRESDKRLQVSFRTKALFNGLFVLKAKGNLESEVRLLHNPAMTFSLKLIKTEATYEQPEQSWLFTSKYAAHDYSGIFLFNLIPCIVATGFEYTSTLACTPHKPLSFQLNLTIQQTSVPEEASFSIKTKFHLFHSEQKSTISTNVSNVFKEDEKIYGYVMIDSLQPLGNVYEINIEKVFLCSGLDGYVPSFDPKQGRYGCIAESPNLSFRLKILDRLNPETIQDHLNNINFNAAFAIDDIDVGRTEDRFAQPLSDGFSLESAPLFKVSSVGRWYLHVIYSICTTRKVNTKTRNKRNFDNHMHLLSSATKNRIRKKREPYESQIETMNFETEIDTIGRNGGTNMQVIILESSESTVAEKSDFFSSSSSSFKGNVGTIAVLILLLIVNVTF